MLSPYHCPNLTLTEYAHLQSLTVQFTITDTSAQVKQVLTKIKAGLGAFSSESGEKAFSAWFLMHTKLLNKNSYSNYLDKIYLNPVKNVLLWRT